MFKYLLSALLVFLMGMPFFNNIVDGRQRFWDYPSWSKPTTTVSKAEAKQIVYGRVIHVSDGDTLSVQKQNGEKIKVRLYGIDAPEKAQPYGPQATGILRNIVGNQFVKVKVNNLDRYGRSVAWVYLDNQDINAEMISLGAAWHYRYYDKSEEYSHYEQLEQKAKAQRKGLWNRDNPTPPWDYRKTMREQGKM